MTAGVVLTTSSGIRVKLDGVVVARLATYRQTRPRQHEAGGVLLGRHLLDSGDIVVDDISEPMPGDTRSRFGFRRQQKSHQIRVDNAWLASRGTCVYLGEWHTHPEPDPTPSSTDLADWRRHLQVDVFDGDCLYFLIVGTRALRVWEGARSTLLLRPLSQAAQTVDALDASGEEHP